MKIINAHPNSPFQKWFIPETSDDVWDLVFAYESGNYKGYAPVPPAHITKIVDNYESVPSYVTLGVAMQDPWKGFHLETLCMRPQSMKAFGALASGLKPQIKKYFEAGDKSYD